MVDFLRRMFILCVFIIFIMDSTGELLHDYNPDESSLITQSIDVENSTDISSSVSTSSTTTKDDTSSSTTTSKLQTTTEIPAISLVDQFNFYRQIAILSRIKQCDPKLILNDICESYSFDKKTNSLISQSNIEFYTLEQISGALVDLILIEKLKKLCLLPNWCLGNISQNDIQFTSDIIRERGQSFCSLQQCHSRLLVFINSCPKLTNMNISIPTFRLLPMLCTLYEEQQNWSSTQCTEQIVYLLHILYAFWPQIKTCPSDRCSLECQKFDDILTTVDNQCNGSASFLFQVPILAWYRSINLKQICHQKNISTRDPFITSVEKFFAPNKFWHKISQQPLYIALFIVTIISIIMSFSLCFYFISKHRLNSTDQRSDDNYEYTRLHNSTFELGTSTEIPNMNSTVNGHNDESQFDSNGRFRSSEYQRLLHLET